MRVLKLALVAALLTGPLLALPACAQPSGMEDGPMVPPPPPPGMARSHDIRIPPRMEPRMEPKGAAGNMDASYGGERGDPDRGNRGAPPPPRPRHG